MKSEHRFMRASKIMESKTKVAVGMSGGLDSSVAAALLVDQGYEVIGLTAHMWMEGSRCCSVEDVDRARKVAWFLGIQHYVLNAYETFSTDVVGPFVSEYIQGRTPSPCIVCNQKIKFGFLLTRAVQFGCAALATGHYAKVIRTNGCYRLYKAKDVHRDQSYFLHRLSQRQLTYILFPLAEMIKSTDVIEYARNRTLPITHWEESQDLCFVPDGQYARFVEDRVPEIRKSGPILNTSGQKIGTHEGLHRYTVGQRHGLGIAEGKALYVTRIDPARNIVEVGTREEAMRQRCRIECAHWINGRPPDPDRAYTVHIRYRHEGTPARIRLEGEGSFVVEFLTPQFAVSPGQAGVIYDGDEVLGGGWIAD